MIFAPYLPAGKVVVIIMMIKMLRDSHPWHILMMMIVILIMMMVKIATMMMMLKLTSFFFLSRLLLILGHRLHLAIVIILSYFFLKLVFHSHSIHISFILSYSTDHQRIVFSISHFIHILMQKFVLLITDKISTCTPGLRLGKGECEGDDV